MQVLVSPCTMARAARHEIAVRSMSIDLRCLENSTISSIQGPKLTSTWLRWRTQPLSNRKRSSVSRLILKQENVEFHPFCYKMAKKPLNKIDKKNLLTSDS